MPYGSQATALAVIFDPALKSMVLDVTNQDGTVVDLPNPLFSKQLKQRSVLKFVELGNKLD